MREWSRDSGLLGPEFFVLTFPQNTGIFSEVSCYMYAIYILKQALIYETMNDPIRFRMIRFSFFFCLLTMPLLHAHAQSHEKVIAVQVRADIPVAGYDGTILFHQTDTTDIYYYKNFILKDLRYQYMEMDMRQQKEEDQLKVLETRRLYFVYERDSLYGFVFYLDKNEKKTDRWELATKIVSGTTAFKIDLLQMYLSKTIINPTVDPVTGDLQESYVDKPGDASRDTLSITYTGHMQDIPFTFDKQLDSAKGKKVRTIKIINGPQPLPDRHVTIPYRINTFEMERLSVENEQKIMDFFNRFMKLRRPENE